MKFKNRTRAVIKGIAIIPLFLIGVVIGVILPAIKAGIEWGEDNFYTNEAVK